MQFREIEFSSGLKDARVLDNFSSDEFAHARLQVRYDSPTLTDALYAYLRRRGLDAPDNDLKLTAEENSKRYNQRTRAVLEILTHFESRYEEFQLVESLIEHDEYFSLWRFHHVKMVERMVGAKRGTGGSEGIGYLRTTLEKKFFPELWEARTYLDTKHGEGGCPFASKETQKPE
jgi:tryptophan 2,3-dioxygenase